MPTRARRARAVPAAIRTDTLAWAAPGWLGLPVHDMRVHRHPGQAAHRHAGGSDPAHTHEES